MPVCRAYALLSTGTVLGIERFLASSEAVMSGACEQRPVSDARQQTTVALMDAVEPLLLRGQLRRSYRRSSAPPIAGLEAVIRGHRTLARASAVYQVLRGRLKTTSGSSIWDRDRRHETSTSRPSATHSRVETSISVKEWSLC